MKTFAATEFTARDPDGRFTRAELEVLAWMAEGKENVAIGLIRGHGLPGAKKLTRNVMQKLEANNRCLAISRAFALGYLIACDLSRAPRHLAAIGLFVCGSLLSNIVDSSEDLHRRGAKSSRIVRTGRHDLDNPLNNWLEGLV